MPATRKASARLPGRFNDLVALMPPQAINNESQYRKTVDMVDRLMARGKSTRGQSLYLETLVQLVEAYEAQHHSIDTTRLSGQSSLKYLMEQNGMNASDLGRLLGIHATMGSKIINGERSLTVEHLKKLAKRFRVSPQLFMN
jgi:HTH-type transcriptional regulator/antitoxin HigA